MRKSIMAEQPRTFRPKRLALSFKLRSARLIARIYLLSLSPMVLGELEPHTSTLIMVFGAALPRRPRREGGEATILVAATTQGGKAISLVAATTQGGEATILVAATTQGGKATTLVISTTQVMR